VLDRRFLSHRIRDRLHRRARARFIPALPRQIGGSDREAIEVHTRIVPRERDDGTRQDRGDEEERHGRGDLPSDEHALACRPDGADGVVAARQIRQHRRARQLPCRFEAEDDERQQRRDAGDSQRARIQLGLDGEHPPR
jgi:hypothetical protein